MKDKKGVKLPESEVTKDALLKDLLIYVHTHQSMFDYLVKNNPNIKMPSAQEFNEIQKEVDGKINTILTNGAF